MFEKEAEEYKDNTRIKDKNTYILFPNERISELQDYEGNYIDISERIIKTFKDASEFGYNKANEWNYPSKGEFPKVEAEYLVIFESDGTKYKGLESYYPDTKEWSTICKIIAWKEIVPPELKEIE